MIGVLFCPQIRTCEAGHLAEGDEKPSPILGIQKLFRVAPMTVVPVLGDHGGTQQGDVRDAVDDALQGIGITKSLGVLC